MSAAAPPHVLITADAVGGVWTYALGLAAGLRARGSAVTLAVLGPSPSPAQRAEAKAIPGIDVVETELPLDWDPSTTPAALHRAGERLADLAAWTGADLVHLNAPIVAAGIAFPVPVVGACHSCVATWWEAVKGGDLPESFAWRAARLAEGYRACDRLLAPSRAFAAATERRYAVAVAAIANGSAASRPTGRPDRKRVAMASGRLWDEGKGIALLDEAAGRMQNPVEAAGPLVGPNGSSIRLRNIEVLGPLPPKDHAERLEGAAVYVSTALYEPFGLGVLEAASAGAALVLSDIATFRELWEGVAIFVDAGDPKGVALALDGLLDDRGRTAALGAKAAARAADFSIDATVDATLALYREVLSATAGPREAAA